MWCITNDKDIYNNLVINRWDCFIQYFLFSGNRWLLPVWVKLPSKQPPLDLSELEAGYSVPRPVYDTEVPEEFLELHKRESDL